MAFTMFSPSAKVFADGEEPYTINFGESGTFEVDGKTATVYLEDESVENRIKFS